MAVSMSAPVAGDTGPPADCHRVNSVSSHPSCEQATPARRQTARLALKVIQLFAKVRHALGLADTPVRRVGMQREISRWISPGHRVVFTLRHLVFAQPKSFRKCDLHRHSIACGGRVTSVRTHHEFPRRTPAKAHANGIDEPFSGLPTFAQGIRSRELKEFADPARRGAGRPAARCLGQGRGGFLY